MSFMQCTRTTLSPLACTTQAISSIGVRCDSAGERGVYVDAGVVKAAAPGAMAANLRRLAPSVLPWSEMVLA